MDKLSLLPCHVSFLFEQMQKQSRLLKMKGLTLSFQLSEFEVFQGRASNQTIKLTEMFLLLRELKGGFLPEDKNGTFLDRVFLGRGKNIFLHQNGNICMFFKCVCLRIRGKLFLVVSDHAFGKENIAVSMLCVQVIEWADPGFGMLVSWAASTLVTALAAGPFPKRQAKGGRIEAPCFGKPCKYHMP